VHYADIKYVDLLTLNFDLNCVSFFVMWYFLH